MEKTNDEIKSRWTEIDTRHIERACEHLRAFEGDVRCYIADFVAALCGVDKQEMFSASDVVYLAHARWLYWYTCRYATNESYDKIARHASGNDHVFVQRTIQSGVNKMAMMIEREQLWNKRWLAIRRLLRLRDDDTAKEKNNTIVINVPKELMKDVKIEIKEYGK